MLKTILTLIGALTAHTLVMALEQMANWERDGLRMSVAVNLSAQVIHRQRVGNPVQHPGAAHVEAGKVGQLAIRGIGHAYGRQLARQDQMSIFAQKTAQPAAKFGGRPNAPHQVGFGQRG